MNRYRNKMHTLFTCYTIVILQSNITPRFLTLLQGLMFTFPTEISILPTLLSCCFVPIITTSVFDSFNFSKFDCIQDRISAIQSLISFVEVLESFTEKNV